jgi:hypothetical protein
LKKEEERKKRIRRKIRNTSYTVELLLVSLTSCLTAFYVKINVVKVQPSSRVSCYGKCDFVQEVVGSDVNETHNME